MRRDLHADAVAPGENKEKGVLTFRLSVVAFLFGPVLSEGDAPLAEDFGDGPLAALNAVWNPNAPVAAAGDGETWNPRAAIVDL